MSVRFLRSDPKSTMHILFANNFYYLRGGSERVLFDEMEVLGRNGHRTAIFSRSHPSTLVCPDQEYFSAYKDLAALRWLERVRYAADVVYNREAKRAFTRMLRQKRPDLVHAHNIYGGLTTSVLDGARSLGIPSVLTLHDLKLACPAHLMHSQDKPCEKCRRGQFYHCAANRCVKGGFAGSVIYTAESYFSHWGRKYHIPRFLISPSKFVMQMVREAGYPEERIVHIPNMVDVQRYHPNPNSGDYALFVGRLSQEKGVMVLLEAFRGLNIPLRIVGTGPVEEDLRRFAERLGMNHVVFEGHKSGEALHEIYRGVRIYSGPFDVLRKLPDVHFGSICLRQAGRGFADRRHSRIDRRRPIGRPLLARECR